jgi:sugar (pentulose or hexulose) kinase
MNPRDVRSAIEAGRTALGVELGSSRIKAVLIGEDHAPIASGSHDWENRLEDGLWTYRLDDVEAGLRHAYEELAAEVLTTHGIPLSTVGAMGVSAMMHGYLAFDRDGRLLVPFRTWRNVNTARAAAALSDVLGFNIPLRWSVAHLYQAILDGEPHVGRIDHLTTLAGYVHWRLTGRKVIGIGDASGMFPVDGATRGYDARRVARFDELVAEHGLSWRLADLLPPIEVAGADAGVLTEEGAQLLDPSGQLRPGIMLCPPEGDAGTGMVATNSVAPRTANVSAGTSVFAMFVLERDLARAYPEVDMVTTPTGAGVAMVHSNNGSSDIDAWVSLFGEFAAALGMRVGRSAVFEALYGRALTADPDGGGLLAYNYLSGEPLTQLEEGRPLLVRKPEARFNLGNLMRAHLYSAVAALRIGSDILLEEESVRVDRIFGHGGFFKTRDAGQRVMAAAFRAPVSVMETAGEGGAWGIALLAAYRRARVEGDARALEAWLTESVFRGVTVTTVDPDPRDVDGFATFLGRYREGLPIERAAVRHLR